MHISIGARGLRGIAFLLALATSASLASCEWVTPAHDPCGAPGNEGWINCEIGRATARTPNSNSRHIVYEAPGSLRVMHGQSCVQAPNAADASHFGFRIHDQESVPLAFADMGTVFINGWQLRYLNGDHHVKGFGSAIVNIRELRNLGNYTLSWDAGGIISDDNGDDPYEWCYSYTILFWLRSASTFDAIVTAWGLNFMHATVSDPGNSTALRNLYGWGPDYGYPGAVLPQGFALMWAGSGDRHVLQAGFDLGLHTTNYDGTTSWVSRTVLKDNDERNDYYGGAVASVLSYPSVQQWHPSSVQRDIGGSWAPVDNGVSLAPRAADEWNCGAIASPLREEHYKIENVPFHYAVPMLSGWELGYICADHHVRQAGAILTDFHYERDAAASTGTLFYTVSLSLSDDANFTYGVASIDVLGLNALGPGPHPVLVPGTPVPRTDPVDCSFNNQTIANGASVRAYESPTTALCEPCRSQLRVCNNGTLSGDYAYAACKSKRPKPPAACP